MKKTRDYSKMSPLQVYALVAKGVLKTFPNNYLDEENIKCVVRHLILNVYKLNREDVLKISHNFFQDNFIGGARKFFNNSDKCLLVECFPEWEIKYWEFRQVTPKFWEDKENQKEFVIWLGKKENIDINTKEGLRKITAQMVYKYAGSKPLVYAGGMYELLDTIACGRYKIWEITKVVSWSKEEAIDAIKWLVEEKLCYNLEQACTIQVKDFAENNLDGMLQKVCNHSVYQALEMAYPDTFIRNSLRNISIKE